MHDQARDLRRLVQQCAESETLAAGPRPALVPVAGGKGGVGTTTVAVNLAVAMARRGLRTVLVDAEPHGGDVATVCGLEERYNLADVLSGHRTIGEVLQPGPGAVQVLPGASMPERPSDFSPVAGQRLLRQLCGLGPHSDLVLLDAGNRTSDLMEPFWPAADFILMVTTIAVPAILDTYAAIKALALKEKPAPIHALVNRAPSPQTAENVHARLAGACRRFLALHLGNARYISDDPQLVDAAGSVVIAAPHCEVARQLERLADTLPLGSVNVAN